MAWSNSTGFVCGFSDTSIDSLGIIKGAESCIGASGITLKAAPINAAAEDIATRKTPLMIVVDEAVIPLCTSWSLDIMLKEGIDQGLLAVAMADDMHRCC